MESFNAKLRDELFDWDSFHTLWEAQVLTARYRQTYNHIRPHSSLGYRSPAAILPAEPVPMLAGLTTMMDSGHLGPSLTVGLTGSNALAKICRLDPDMAHTASTAMGAVT